MKHPFILLGQEQNLNILNYSDFLPAKEDNGIKYKNDLTFNLMEIITKMKNKKSDNKEINKELLLNLSLLLNLCQEKNIPLELQKTGNENKIYSFYFPLKKISIDNQINFDGKEKLNENIINDDIENNSLNNSKNISFDLTYYSSKSLSCNNDNLIEDKNNYEINFSECPIISDEKDNSQDYLNLFNQIMEIEEKDNNNDNINDDKENKKKDNSFTLLNNSTNDNSINCSKNLMLTPTQENKKINNFINQNLTPTQHDININFFNNNIYSLSPIKNNQKLNFYNLNQNYYQNLVNSINKIYIDLMYYHYSDILKICNSNEKFFINKNIKISFFLAQLKKFILKIGINDQTLYQAILKNILSSNQKISFEEFLKCFDLVINLSNPKIREKYNFLFYILKKSFNQIYYSQKDIQNFFKLISSNKIYNDELTDDIIERLINRYKSIYQNDEKENIQNKKFHIRKLNVVLGTFFDDFI